MNKIIKILDAIIYWTIVMLPFSIAIAPAPMNVFIGLLLFSFLAKKLIKKERLLVERRLVLALLSFFIVTCISLRNSLDFGDSLRGGVLRTIQYMFLLLAVAESIKTKTQAKAIVFSAVAGLLLISLDGAWQVISGKDFIRGYVPTINIGLIRATASFKDANTLGIYLSAFAPLVFALSLVNLSGRRRLFFACVSLVSLLGILLTYSRPTLLAVFVVLWFLSVAARKKILFAALLILTLALPFLLPRSVKEFARQVEYNPLRFMCNDDRIAVYRNSLNMIKAHPLIGVGANAFMKSYKYYKEKTEYRNVVTLDEMKAHNLYLHLAAEAGILGLGIFFWLLYVIFRAALRFYRSLSDVFLRGVLLGLVVGLIGFLVNGLTESSLSYSRVALIFWYLAGFLCAMGNFVREESG